MMNIKSYRINLLVKENEHVEKSHVWRQQGAKIDFRFAASLSRYEILAKCIRYEERRTEKLRMNVILFFVTSWRVVREESKRQTTVEPKGVACRRVFTRLDPFLVLSSCPRSLFPTVFSRRASSASSGFFSLARSLSFLSSLFSFPAGLCNP